MPYVCGWTLASITVTESLIDNYGAGGIVCSERRTDCTITDSAVRGRGPVDDQAQGGIIIRVGASATIVGNIITDHFFTPAKGTKEFSVGIFLFFADPQNGFITGQVLYADGGLTATQ